MLGSGEIPKLVARLKKRNEFSRLGEDVVPCSARFAGVGFLFLDERHEDTLYCTIVTLGRFGRPWLQPRAGVSSIQVTLSTQLVRHVKRKRIGFGEVL